MSHRNLIKVQSAKRENLDTNIVIRGCLTLLSLDDIIEEKEGEEKGEKDITTRLQVVEENDKLTKESHYQMSIGRI